MRWKSNDELPASVKKSLPEEAQTKWREAANAMLDAGKAVALTYATAWAELRRSGWKMAEGNWVEVAKLSDINESVASILEGNSPNATEPSEPIDQKSSMLFNFKVEKSDDAKQIAFGWCVWSRDKYGMEVVDRQNDCIDPEDLEAMAYRYVQFYRDAGAEHKSKGKGVLIESVVTTLEKQLVWGIPSGVLPIGWWIGFKITDKTVWEKVKSGEYEAFSIEGEAERLTV